MASSFLETSARALDLVAMLRHAVDVWADEAAARQVTLRLSVDKALPPVLANGHKVQQAIEHVLSTIVALSGAKASVRIEAGVEGGEAAVCISGDRPVPPPASDGAQRLDFVRVAAALYTARSIIADHGGQLWVDRDAGTPPACRFTLPLATSGPILAGGRNGAMALVLA